MSENPIRFCPICKVADDHPRHDFNLTDPAVSPHMDCCAANNCPDGSCPVVLKNADGVTGEELRQHIIDNVEEIQTDLDERDDATKHFTVDDLKPHLHGAVVAGPIELQRVNN